MFYGFAVFFVLAWSTMAILVACMFPVLFEPMVSAGMYADAFKFGVMFLLLLATLFFKGIIYMFPTYWILKQTWWITEKSITLHGLFRDVKIDFAEVESFRWAIGGRLGWLCPALSMRMASSSSRLLLPFFFPLTFPQAIVMVEHLRQTIPPDRQQHWPLFCRRYLLPYMHRKQKTKPPHGGYTNETAVAAWEQFVAQMRSASRQKLIDVAADHK